MKGVVVLLLVVCVWLLIDRQRLAKERESALAAEQQEPARRNWVLERIQNSGRLLDQKPRSVGSGTGTRATSIPVTSTSRLDR